MTRKRIEDMAFEGGEDPFTEEEMARWRSQYEQRPSPVAQQCTHQTVARQRCPNTALCRARPIAADGDVSERIVDELCGPCLLVAVQRMGPGRRMLVERMRP